MLVHFSNSTAQPHIFIDFTLAETLDVSPGIFERGMNQFGDEQLGLVAQKITALWRVHPITCRAIDLTHLKSLITNVEDFNTYPCHNARSSGEGVCSILATEGWLLPSSSLWFLQQHHREIRFTPICKHEAGTFRISMPLCVL
mmetsp:Transcript_39200/g.107935  ORF Transcript_39200/g.107935 Transcript_39200/m.107935 type:complete len:143 (+) Transcript_39200:52-480(+)